MRTFLAAVVVASIILGLSSCGMMMFGAGRSKPKEETKKEEVSTEIKEIAQEVKKEVKQEVKEDIKEELQEASVEEPAKLHVQKSVDEVWFAGLSVIKRMGLTTSTDMKNGRIQAKVQSAQVSINIIKADGGVDIEVKAEKGARPVVDLASEILSKIRLQLKS